MPLDQVVLHTLLQYIDCNRFIIQTGPLVGTPPCHNEFLLATKKTIHYMYLEF